MTPDEILRSCRDPQIRVIKAQAFALRLLARGLRPKKVAIATGISQWKVNDLRRGLMPDDRLARPPMSVATILRRPWLRAGASLFVGVHQRIVDGEADIDDPWSLFLESYDIYALLAGRLRDVWPLLAIEDACTISWRSKAVWSPRLPAIAMARAIWSCPAMIAPGAVPIARWKPANGHFL